MKSIKCYHNRPVYIDTTQFQYDEFEYFIRLTAQQENINILLIFLWN